MANTIIHPKPAHLAGDSSKFHSKLVGGKAKKMKKSMKKAMKGKKGKKPMRKTMKKTKGGFNIKKNLYLEEKTGITQKQRKLKTLTDIDALNDFKINLFTERVKLLKDLSQGEKKVEVKKWWNETYLQKCLKNGLIENKHNILHCRQYDTIISKSHIKKFVEDNLVFFLKKFEVYEKYKKYKDLFVSTSNKIHEKMQSNIKNRNVGKKFNDVVSELKTIPEEDIGIFTPILRDTCSDVQNYTDENGRLLKHGEDLDSTVKNNIEKHCEKVIA